jgi:ribosome-associated protein
MARAPARRSGRARSVWPPGWPRLDRPRFRALIAKAREERNRGQPPHAFRELFRELKTLDGDAA